MANDMTKGKLLPLIIKFTIPLVLGNILQLTYNAIDSIIVGQYLGSKALAAVGVSNPLMSFIILLLNGITLGASVLIGTLYGTKDLKKLERQLSTTLISGSVFSIILSIICIIMAPYLLLLLQVNTSVLNLATLYLKIIMAGLLFTFIYNFFASSLRALGDSVSPLLFLAISAICNIILDILFVVILKLGVAGCAFATLLSEILSCVLCYLYIIKKVPLLNLKRKWFIFDYSLLKKTLSYGIVTAMQQSIVQVGKLCIQTMVNSMGVISMATFNIVNRPDDFAVLPQVNIAHSMTAIMAQNSGAKKHKRVYDTFKIGMIIELIYSISIGILFYIFAKPIMLLFTKDKEIILLGIKYLHIISFIYVIPSITNAMQGYFRGIGDLKITFYSSLINVLGRLISCFILVYYYHLGLTAIPYSYAIGWGLMLLFELPFIILKLCKKN